MTGYSFHNGALRLLRCLGLGAAFVATQAGAQAIFLTAPPAVSHVDQAPLAAPEPATPPPQPAPQPAPPPPAPSAAARPATPPTGKTRATMLRHLTNNIQGYRLAGETGVSEWPMFITDLQARRKLQFQLGYLAAVSVMPEESKLLLTINDQIVGATPVNAVQSVKTVVFDIPPGLMRPGFNSVRISTEQRHRVDCSLEATNELWTQIDPTQTGLILDVADANIDSLADLGALPADEQGALPIRAVTPANPRTSDIERLLRVVQLISIVGRFEQPVVDSGPPAGGRYGVNLLVGTAAELAAVAGAELVGAASKPRAFVLPATGERRATIVVTGADAAQVDEAIKQFLVATKPKGAAAGLRAAAAFPGFRLEGGQRVRLSELGVNSAEFSGRLYRAAFNIIMPPDFYPADYGRATLRLAGGYAPGLTSSAQVVMTVNERTAVSLPLLKSTGEVFKDNPLPIPLGFLHPGLNRIEIEAHVPSPADDSCDTLATKNAPNRFLFHNSTEIEIPLIARVGRMPDLAVTATGGFPYAGAARRSKLYLPRLDQKSIGAAATIVAHLAVAAGRPIDFEITRQPPHKNNGPTLAVAPYDALDPDLLRRLSMPVDDLAGAWRDKIGVENAPVEAGPGPDMDAVVRNRLVLQNNFPMACRAPRTANAFGSIQKRVEAEAIDAAAQKAAAEAPAAGEPATASRDLFQEWDERVRNERRWSVKLGEWAYALRQWVTAKFTDAGEWAQKFERGGEKKEITPLSLLAIGQNILGEASDDVWTVVTSPNADMLAESVACLVDPRVSRQISGRVSLLDLGRAKIETTPVTSTRFVVTQPLSVGNARLIAAGWLSLNSLYYVASAVWLGLLLAATTRLFVKNVGRRTE